MKIVVKCKLRPTPEQEKVLKEAMERCLDAMNYVSKVAWSRKCFNRVALHYLTYKELRERFGLTAQLAVSVRDKVAFSYKADRSKKHIFKKAVLPLDPPRSFRLILNGGEYASISTLRGRQKIALELGEYQRNWFKGRTDKICESEVVKNSEYYLHLTLEVEELPPKEFEDFLGVDLGIKNLATTSDGDYFSGEKAEKVRLRYERLRAALQKKGTLSAKKHLKRLSGRERRFKRAINHLISRRIVEKAFSTGRAIVLEMLKGIRKKIKVRKSQSGRHHKWAFGELIRFITYKAKLAGVPVFFLDPRYTSQRCPECGFISRANRRSQVEFLCRCCGFAGNADHIGALNLVWAAVNQPIVLRPA